jgi:hypothetical protein
VPVLVRALVEIEKVAERLVVQGKPPDDRDGAFTSA